jgi:hypothetical protein
MGGELTTAETTDIEQRFKSYLHDAGLPARIFEENEIQDLIRAATWVIGSQVEFEWGYPPGVSPRHKKDLISGTDQFKARTRMALALLEAKGKSIALEEYVGYLCDEWWKYADGSPAEDQQRALSALASAALLDSMRKAFR